MRNRITILFLLVTLLSFFTSALFTQDDRLIKDESSSKNGVSETNISDLIESSQTANITKRGSLEQYVIEVEEEKSSTYRLAYRVHWDELAPIVKRFSTDFMNLHGQLPTQKTFTSKTAIFLKPELRKESELDEPEEPSDIRRREEPLLRVSVTLTFNEAYDDLDDDREYVIDLIIEKFLSLQCYGSIYEKLTIHAKDLNQVEVVEGMPVVTAGELFATAEIAIFPKAVSHPEYQYPGDGIITF